MPNTFFFFIFIFLQCDVRSNSTDLNLQTILQTWYLKTSKPSSPFWFSASKWKFLCIDLLCNVVCHLINDCFEVSDQTKISKSLKTQSTAKIVSDLAPHVRGFYAFNCQGHFEFLFQVQIKMWHFVLCVLLNCIFSLLFVNNSTLGMPKNLWFRYYLEWHLAKALASRNN